ncbi:TIGR02302 family protein [Azospirillum thermophilum]|uniref:TIGR02302 family protein n=1 Tax=Azospirillum thermophilum TaxID=2202148 RepID=A0A2S2CWK5_9PROT|nr:TIGR02302 family protein [Azospirillum thermophilum]AWK88838.1 TIGR02302 family protein [Azospirillum thermophilum]
MSEQEQRTSRSRTAADHPAAPRLRLIEARAALLWERLWPALWAPASIAGLFLALALSGLLPGLPGWLHSAVLILLAAAFVLSLVFGFRRFSLPGEAEIRRRLERDSGLPHRPLHTLADRPAGGDPVAEALWALHQERVRAAMRRLRVAFPQSDVPSRDRFALRALVVLVLVAVGGATWGDWRPRLAAALTPHFGVGTVTAAATLDLWVAPPEYTGLPPVFLKTGSAGTQAPAAEGAGAQPVPVPRGSLVLARVTGGRSTPTLEAGDRTAAFEAVDAATFQIQQPIEGGTRISVTQGGGTLGSWPVRVVPDNPPIIAHANPPSKSERAALKLDYAARDDYGLAEVKAVIRLATEGAEGTEDGAIAALRDAPPIELPLSLPGVRPKEAHASGFHDLTPHPWAGLPVTIRLVATDGAGQTGSSEEAALTLPERVFSHPVARALVEQRKQLTLRPKDAHVDVARALADISARPGTYGGDIVAFLAMRTAIGRLMLDRSEESVPPVQQLLWETALRIEDGGVSQAERDLRNAEQRLSEALERNASDEELRKLMDELQAALDAFMQAMEQQMMEALKRGEQIPTIPPELADRMMDRNDLQQMMDQMRQMAETGSRDAARQMLSQLQQMLENMRNGAMAMQMQQQQQNGQNQAWEMMRELQEMARQQQQLLDQSFRQSQEQMQREQNGQPMPRSRQGRQGQQNQQGQGSMQGSPTLQKQAEQQEALRRQLGELMRRMGEATGGEIPRPLGRAERAMRDAGQALQQGSPSGAVPPQTQAMDELQQGMQGLAEQLAQQMMGQGPMMMGQPQGTQQRPSRGRDPLGRRPSGFGSIDANDVKIPEQSDLQRAREILDELRRRSGQYSRPQTEREYIDRLLKQF